MPSVGSCDIDFDVEYDEKFKAWVVDLHHGNFHSRTFIETDVANDCLEGIKFTGEVKKWLGESLACCNKWNILCSS